MNRAQKQSEQTAQLLQFPLANRSTVALAEGALAVNDITRQYEIIVNAMKNVMKPDEHYGTIPGCGNKKTLLKPGAEVLLVLFGLTSEPDVLRFDMPNGHRECVCKCTIFSPTGRRLATGVGSCSTMESKYRFRSGPVEITGKRVPSEFWNLRDSDPKKAQELLGGKGFVAKKGEDKKWYIAIQGERVENDNPADQYNTVFKMSHKRSLIDGVLYSTAASFLFTQDLEDMLENGIIYIPPEKVAGKGKNKPQESQRPEDFTPAGATDTPAGDGSGASEESVSDETPATPDQIPVALERKKIKFTTTDEGEIRVSLSFSDKANRLFVSELGFKWLPSEKVWSFKP